MKKIYLSKKLKTYTLILSLQLLCCISTFAQTTVDVAEKAENKSMRLRDKVYNNLIKTLNLSSNQFKEFLDYNVDSISTYIANSFTYFGTHPNMTKTELQQYLAMTEARYFQLYTRFQQIKMEFPSSVAEVIDDKRNPHQVTSGTIQVPCDNLGFEDGDLTGWSCGYASCKNEDVYICASTSSSGGQFPAFIYAPKPPTLTASTSTIGGGPDVATGSDYQDSIFSAGSGAKDPIGGFPCVCPGYNYSCRVGDGANSLVASTPNYGVAFLEQTFNVYPSNIYFYYNYAAVLENPAQYHCLHQQPYFRIVFLDVNGDTIPSCGNVISIAGDTNNGKWVRNKTTGIDYLPWTSGFISLKRYLGQAVTVVVMSSDCGLGGHYGYLYFDAKCGATDILQSSPAICGNSITLTAPAGGISYQWTGPCITTSDTAQAISVSCAGKYSVAIKHLNSLSCIDTLNVNVVADTPKITIASSPVNDTVCAGSSITLTANGGSTYSWNGGISNGVSFSPSATGTYVVTGTDSVGCSAMDSVTITAGSGALPVVTATSLPTNDTICQGSSITLNALGAYYYNWSGGISNGVSFTPSASGKYIVTGTNTNGCSNTDTINVTVNMPPVITISGKTPILPGTVDTLMASGAVSYIWNTGGTNDTIIIAPVVNTKYIATATGTNGCSDTASYTVIMQTITSLGIIANSGAIDIYPNPVTDFLNLDLNSVTKGLTAEIKITDMSGKLMMGLSYVVDGSKIVPIKMTQLASGVYFISIETSSAIKTLKFVKE